MTDTLIQATPDTGCGRTLLTRVCYRDKVGGGRGTRILWGDLQQWNASNPTFATLAASIQAGTPTLVRNVAGLGVDVTVRGTGTHSSVPTLNIAGDAMRTYSAAGDTAGVTLDWSTPLCAVLSTNNIDANSIAYTSDSALYITPNHLFPTAVLGAVTGQDTSTLTHVGNAAGDQNRSLASTQSTDSFAFALTNSGAADFSNSVGIWLNLSGSRRYWRQDTYSDGEVAIYDAGNPTQAAAAISDGWQAVPCEDVGTSPVEATYVTVPQQHVSHQLVLVDDAQVYTLPPSVGAVGAYIQVQGGPVRFFSGADATPTTTSGYIATDLAEIHLGKTPAGHNADSGELGTFEVIAEAGQTAILAVTYYGA